MSISARIIADSVNPYGVRLVSAIWRYPRYIHSEIMTHRVFSRNAASSRAIPLKKMIESVGADPAQPEFWGKNQRGMQAAEELSPHERDGALTVWNCALNDAVISAKRLELLQVHKQIANRLLEPWAHMTTLVTATEWDNFFALRAHKSAQPEFQVLAYRMLDRYLKSTPKRLDFSEWHMPFGDHMRGISDPETRLKIATARAARVSYVTFDGNASVDDDVRLHDQLLEAGHMSPFEHCAKAVSEVGHEYDICSNFSAGWLQYRKTIPDENREVVDLHAIMAAKPEWITLEE